ncbi:MAG: type II toxin-antitoxin system Phd/YefM family antitoxin [Solirubrobacterales bacterium]
MKVRVDLQELQDKTDQVLDKVESGKTVVITQSGKAVAELVPHKSESNR